MVEYVRLPASGLTEVAARIFQAAGGVARRGVGDRHQSCRRQSRRPRQPRAVPHSALSRLAQARLSQLRPPHQRHHRERGDGLARRQLWLRPGARAAGGRVRAEESAAERPRAGRAEARRASRPHRRLGRARGGSGLRLDPFRQCGEQHRWLRPMAAASGACPPRRSRSAFPTAPTTTSFWIFRRRAAPRARSWSLTNPARQCPKAI